MRNTILIDGTHYVVTLYHRSMVRNIYRRLRQQGLDRGQAHDAVGRSAIAFGTRVTQ
jgi:hypothetical protein